MKVNVFLFIPKLLRILIDHINMKDDRNLDNQSLMGVDRHSRRNY